MTSTSEIVPDDGLYLGELLLFEHYIQYRLRFCRRVQPFEQNLTPK